MGFVGFVGLIEFMGFLRASLGRGLFVCATFWKAPVNVLVV